MFTSTYPINKKFVKIRGAWIDPNQVSAVGIRGGDIIVDLNSGSRVNLGPGNGDDVYDIVKKLVGKDQT